MLAVGFIQDWLSLWLCRISSTILNKKKKTSSNNTYSKRLNRIKDKGWNIDELESEVLHKLHQLKLLSLACLFNGVWAIMPPGCCSWVWRWSKTSSRELLLGQSSRGRCRESLRRVRQSACPFSRPAVKGGELGVAFINKYISHVENLTYGGVACGFQLFHCILSLSSTPEKKFKHWQYLLGWFHWLYLDNLVLFKYGQNTNSVPQDPNPELS